MASYVNPAEVVSFYPQRQSYFNTLSGVAWTQILDADPLRIAIDFVQLSGIVEVSPFNNFAVFPMGYGFVASGVKLTFLFGDYGGVVGQKWYGRQTGPSELWIVETRLDPQIFPILARAP